MRTFRGLYNLYAKPQKGIYLYALIINYIIMETTMKKITPNIMVDNVNATIDYYKNNLEFQIVMGVNGKKEVKMGDSATETTLTWAILKKDDVEIMLQREDSLIEELSEFKGLKIGGTFTLYISGYVSYESGTLKYTTSY